MPAEGVSPRAGTQGPKLAGDTATALGAGYFAHAKFRHDSAEQAGMTGRYRLRANSAMASSTAAGWSRCGE